MNQRMSSFGRIVALLLVVSATCSGAVVKFKDLPSEVLPYGEAITITGELSDFTAQDQAGHSVTVADWIDIKNISVAYVIGGTTKTAQAQITATAWQVAIEALPEKTQVSLTFNISGNLSQGKIMQAISDVVGDPGYNVALATFLQTFAASTSRDLVDAAAQKFIQALAPIVKSKLQIPFQTKEGVGPPQALVAGQQADLVRRAAAASNMPDRIKFLADRGLRNPNETPVATVKDVLTIAASAKSSDDLTTVKNVDQRPEVFRAVEDFKADYSVLERAIGANLSLQIPLEAGAQQAADVQDFQKYAGIDAGAIYIPRIQSLMSFYTVNIYFGSVDDSPPRFSAHFLQQRFSLTVGVAVGDLSSQANSQIKGSNAFLAGIGFGVNKYFRLAAGDALFRNKVSDKINHALFIGPSIDLTALGNLKTLLGKTKP